MVERVSVASLLDGHVSLAVDSFDRLLLNGYVPTLQTAGAVVRFLTEHRGNPIPSPALFTPIGDAFRRAVKRFATDRDIPVVRFAGRERKLDVVRHHLEPGPSGVRVIGHAQEFQRVWVGGDARRDPTSGVPHYAFQRVDRRVSVVYFYFWDSAWGPCSLKVCTYFPYPMKLWCNGHEWAKRRLEWAGVGYTPLSNGFAACDDPLALQQTCDQLDAGDVGRLFARCLGSVPLPLTVADRHAGCDWELSCKQVEYSRTLVLDRPLAARQFMETVIAENIGLGRPSEVEVIFGRRVRRNTPGRFHTRIVTRDV
ncbi:MAG: hypothetical protein ACREKR_15130, partial [Candidatus Methylomirabilales bacterium]